MRQLLPDWFKHLVPPGWMPDRAREFYIYTQNIIPIPAGAGLNTTKELVLSKKYDVLVFAASGLVTDVTGTFISSPIGGVWSQALVKLGNPAGNEIYMLDFVPFETVFGNWTGMPAWGGAILDTSGSSPNLFPVPIVVKKGGSLQLLVQNLNGVAARWMRLSFWCALMFDEGFKKPKGVAA